MLLSQGHRGTGGWLVALLMPWGSHSTGHLIPVGRGKLQRCCETSTVPCMNTKICHLAQWGSSKRPDLSSIHSKPTRPPQKSLFFFFFAIGFTCYQWVSSNSCYKQSTMSQQQLSAQGRESHASLLTTACNLRQLPRSPGFWGLIKHDPSTLSGL